MCPTTPKTEYVGVCSPRLDGHREFCKYEPGGVSSPLHNYVTARPATKALVTALLFYGIVAARRPPMLTNSQQRTYRNLCCTVYTVTCQPGTYGLRSRSVEVCGRCDPCFHEDPGQED